MATRGRPLGKLHQEDVRRFYVYHVVDGERVMYIGKGSGNRSQVQQKRFQLPVVIVERFSSEKAAYSREIQMIAEFQPPLNKHKGGNGSKASVQRKCKDGWQLRFERIGSKRYAAILALAFGSSMLEKSKLEQIRQVAYG